jgi:hypothetical protein
MIQSDSGIDNGFRILAALIADQASDALSESERQDSGVELSLGAGDVRPDQPHDLRRYTDDSTSEPYPTSGTGCKALVPGVRGPAAPESALEDDGK